MSEHTRSSQSRRPDSTRRRGRDDSATAEQTHTIAASAGETVITLPTRFGTTVEVRLTARSDGGTLLTVVRERSSTEPPTWGLSTTHAQIQDRLTDLDQVGGFVLGTTTTDGNAVYVSLVQDTADSLALSVETHKSPRPTLIVPLSESLAGREVMDDTMDAVEQASG